MNLINIEEPNKKNLTSKCLGIDFGTTNSVCSIKIGEKNNIYRRFKKY